jgi:hypothetical protein
MLAVVACSSVSRVMLETPKEATFLAFQQSYEPLGIIYGSAEISARLPILIDPNNNGMDGLIFLRSWYGLACREECNVISLACNRWSLVKVVPL